MQIEVLDAQAFTNRLLGLLGSERNVQVDFLLHLAEFDRRLEWAKLGFPSLFDFCMVKLGLLKCATFRRTHAARMLRRFPQAEEYLRDGRLFMTTFVLLEPVITNENATELLDQASRKTRDEVLLLVAGRKVDVHIPTSMIRKLPARVALVSARDPAVEPAPPAQVPETVSLSSVEAAPEPAAESEQACAMPVATKRPATLQPITAELYALRATVSREFVETLRNVQMILSHSIKQGDLEGVLRAGLDAIVAKEAKRHGPLARRSSKSSTAPKVEKPAVAPDTRALDSKGKRRAVPRAVERAVWIRDEGACTWEMSTGKRCGSRYRVQLDHRRAAAFDGASTVDNLRLLCRNHNDQHAREDFGNEFMDRAKTTRGQASSPGRTD